VAAGLVGQCARVVDLVADGELIAPPADRQPGAVEREQRRPVVDGRDLRLVAAAASASAWPGASSSRANRSATSGLADASLASKTMRPRSPSIHSWSRANAPDMVWPGA